MSKDVHDSKKTGDRRPDVGPIGTAHDYPDDGRGAARAFPAG